MHPPPDSLFADIASELDPLGISGMARGAAVGRKQSNLAAALRTLPPDRRADALVFYDFCRLVDDIADAPGLSHDSRRTALACWQSALRGDAVVSVPLRLHVVMERYHLDAAWLLAIVEGCIEDLEPVEFQNFEQLSRYCWNVASAVGLVSIRIFGIPDDSGDVFADKLGHALQLTNILRDVAEDAAAGRVYLPTEELERFGISRDDLLARRAGGASFRRMMEFQIHRAFGLFNAAAAVRPAHYDSALRPADMMGRIYRQLLEKIASDPGAVLSRRVRLNLIEKAWMFWTS